MILCGLVKAIKRHLLTGLNIIIFHDGLFNISYCHYNEWEKLENNYKLHFKNLSIFFEKTCTCVRTPFLLFAFVCFSMNSPLPSSMNILFKWPPWTSLKRTVLLYWKLTFLYKDRSFNYDTTRADLNFFQLQLFSRKLFQI